MEATVDGERLAGLNIHGFSAIKVFTEILSRFLGSLFNTIKKRHLYSQRNFCNYPENCEKNESLPSESFPIYGII